MSLAYPVHQSNAIIAFSNGFLSLVCRVHSITDKLINAAPTPGPAISSVESAADLKYQVYGTASHS